MARTFQHNGETLTIEVSTYGNGNTAVIANGADGMPYGTLSVNMPPYDKLPDGVFFLKDWSENVDLAASFVASGLVKAANMRPRYNGFVAADAYVFAA